MLYPRTKTLSTLGMLCLAALPLRAATIARYDLASLYDKSELIVVVKDFRPGDKNEFGLGTVAKVYKGEHALRASIRILPWAVDFDRMATLTGRQQLLYDAVFFLVRRPDHSGWETVLSGLRVIVEDRVFGVHPQGPYSYTIVPTVPELLEERQPYDAAALHRDILEAQSRVEKVDAAIRLLPSAKSLQTLRTILDNELDRELPGTTRSELILRLLRRFADLGLVEDLWLARERVPRAGLGRELDHLLARSVPLPFLQQRLQPNHAPEELRQTLRFLTTTSFPLQMEVKLGVLEHLLDLSAHYPSSVESLAYEAASAVLEVIPINLTERLQFKLLQAAQHGSDSARFYLRPLILTKYPRLSTLELSDQARMFAFVRVKTHTYERLTGEAKLWRLHSSHHFAEPQLILERISTSGSVLERRTQRITLPTRILRPGRSGRYSTGFGWNLERNHLVRGRWRVSLRLKTSQEPFISWHSQPTEFLVTE